MVKSFQVKKILSIIVIQIFTTNAVVGIEIIRVPRSLEDDRHNLQMVIDSLSTDVLHVSLSHIRAEDILAGDKQAVCNLLEIFQGLMEFILDQLQAEPGTTLTERVNPEENELKNYRDEDATQGEDVLTENEMATRETDSHSPVQLPDR